MSDLTGAETHLSDLERRVALMELGSTGTTAVDDGEMRAFKLNILSKAKMIRDKLVSEGGDPAQLRKERDEVLAENAKLKKEMEKQAYRIRHLLKGLEVAEKQ